MKIEIGKIIELLENEIEILSNEAEDYIDVDMYQKAWNTAYEDMKKRTLKKINIKTEFNKSFKKCHPFKTNDFYWEPLKPSDPNYEKMIKFAAVITDDGNMAFHNWDE